MLWLLVLLLLFLFIAGGVWVSPWLFIFLIIVVLLAGFAGPGRYW